MDDRTPAESARFWRLNTLAAFKGVDLDERQAIDPDDLAAIKAIKKEKERLIEKENTIKARAARIFNRNKPT
jgi:hypothetical protein